MLQMAVVFAELERKIIVERVKAGLAGAKAEGNEKKDDHTDFAS